MHGVLIIEDVCCKKNYWCLVKSIYPLSIFFLYSGPEVVSEVPAMEDALLQDGQSPTGRSLHSLQDARCTSCSTLRWRCVSLCLGCFFRIHSAIEISFHVFFNFYRIVIKNSFGVGGVSALSVDLCM